MSKVSMGVDVDADVINKFVDLLTDHKMLSKDNVELRFKCFLDSIILLFDQEEEMIRVRMEK